MTEKPFQMPQQLRELAEKNIEQARAAYAQFMDAMTGRECLVDGSIPRKHVWIQRRSAIGNPLCQGERRRRV
jgi:hypothetical protein